MRKRSDVLVSLAITVLLAVTPSSAQKGAAEAPGMFRLSARELDRLHSKYDVNLIGKRSVGSGANMYSALDEQEIGSEESEEINESLEIVHDQQVELYVQHVVDELALHSDTDTRFKLSVISDDNVNAFSFPGGYLYVTTGLLLTAEDESELAAVLAHEIAHVAAHHGTRMSTRTTMFRLAALPLAVAGGSIGMGAPAISLVGFLSERKFSRNSENEADLLATQYLYATGYDPESLPSFLERLPQAVSPSKLRALAATHPPTNERITRTRALIHEFLPERTEYKVDSSAFQEAKARIMELQRANPGHNGKPRLRQNPRESPDEGKDRALLDRHL